METILLAGTVIIALLFLGALYKLFQRIKKYYSASNRELRDLEDRIRTEKGLNRMKMPLSAGQIRTSKEFSKFLDKKIELKSSELQNNYEQEMSSINNESHERVEKIKKDADIIMNAIEEKVLGKSLKKELDKKS